MADPEDTRGGASSPVRRKHKHLPYEALELRVCTRHEGTAEQLVERGFPPAWFDRERTTLQTEFDGRRVAVAPYAKYRWHIRVYRTRDEMQAWDRQDKRRQAVFAWQYAQPARDRIQAEIAAMAGSHDQYRERIGQFVELTLNAIERAVGHGIDGGFRFDDDTRDALAMHAAGIRSALAAGRTMLDADARESEVRRLRAKLGALPAPPRDPACDDFLRTLRANG